MDKFIPSTATGKTIKYLAIAAHKDDVEMMAFDGIVKGQGQWGFGAAVLTNGGDCPRCAEYAGLSREDMSELRTAEQKRAAEKGAYEALWLAELNSDEVKNPSPQLFATLLDILRENPRLEALYVHNPFDRHPTHVAACKAALKAVEMLDEAQKPKAVYGCEVWRDLDWLPQKYKTAFDVQGYEGFSAELMSCFASQNSAKRYDVASLARRRVNATYGESHSVNFSDSVIFAVDLKPLSEGGENLSDFAKKVLSDFSDEIFNILDKK